MAIAIIDETMYDFSQRELAHQRKTIMHIIYIEDDPANIALVERVVKMSSDTLTTYTTAEDAAFNIQPDDADIILTDIDFGGGMTGLELTQVLRQRGIEVQRASLWARCGYRSPEVGFLRGLSCSPDE